MTDNWDIYLASPYSHEDHQVREYRFYQACSAAGWLINKGLYVYSPIAHTHPIATVSRLPLGFDYWQGFDTIGVEFCESFAVLMLDGWRQSKGVQFEMELATEMDKEIFFLGPSSNGEYFVSPRIPEELLRLGAQRLERKAE